MRITEEQEKILDSFKCERLTDDKNNIELIKHFKNDRNNGMVQYLNTYAWEQDLSGETAWYLVKTPLGRPCMFFSLKCGALFQPLDEDEIKAQYKSSKKYIELINDKSLDLEDKNRLIAEIEMLRINTEMTVDEVLQYVKYNVKKSKENSQKVLKMIESDKKREGERPIQRVRKTFSGIELCHFCTDDNAKAMWDTYGFRFTMGEVFFWKHIAPIFIDIRRYVGCQYAFLFAADLTPDETLINYYKTTLKFSELTDVGTNKPFYDFDCKFMSQEVSILQKSRDEFFESFNPDDIDEII